MASPLAHPVYRRLFAAQVIALAGTGLSSVALALLAYELAGGDAAVVLGTALALKMVAYVVIAPAVGGVADRVPRRAVLVGLDLARAGLVLALPFVSTVWQIYLLIFLINTCSAGFTPLFQAAIPDILPDEAQYTRALSLSRLAYDLENLLSPMAAALLLTVTGFDALFTLNALAFMASAGLVLSVTLPAPAPSERQEGFAANLTYGVRSYLATPRLRGLLLLSGAVAAAGGSQGRPVAASTRKPAITSRPCRSRQPRSRRASRASPTGASSNMPKGWRPASWAMEETSRLVPKAVRVMVHSRMVTVPSMSTDVWSYTAGTIWHATNRSQMSLYSLNWSSRRCF